MTEASKGAELLKRRRDSFIGRTAELFLRGNLSVLFLLLALIAGAAALMLTPREEEPQIVVPLANVIISVPGASPQEVERQVSTRLEKMLYQIDGVEYVYSMSRPSMAIVTVRFYVGEDREDSLVKIYNQINSNIDDVPASVAAWVVKPVEIDDVPIVNISLYTDPERKPGYSDHDLRRLAEEVEIKLQSIENTNKIYVIGGRPRKIRVQLDPSALAAHSLSPLEIVRALQVNNVEMPAGDFQATNAEYVVEAGRFLDSAETMRQLVVGVSNGKPVRLGSVAKITDGPDEPETYTRMGFGPAADDVPQALADDIRSGERLVPTVSVAVSKKRGTNAVWVANAVKDRMEIIARDIFPDGVHYRITRNYGHTANAKVNELVSGLSIAMVVVIALILLSMGWREAVIVGIAVPVTFSLALMVNYLLGYTINRVTLFALTLALGIVVDDPIVCVDNITRHFTMGKQSPLKATMTAILEILPPVILTTVVVVVSFAPLFFITGMMGPYMRPMALNVPLALSFSTVVALTLTPWMSYHLLKGRRKKIEEEEEEYQLEKTLTYRAYKRVLPFFLNSRKRAWALLGFMMFLFCAAGMLAALRFVPLKMLPFDNKNEFQIVVDMPEGTTLETTDAALNALAQYLRTVPEVVDFQTYAGTASAMDFNGMVRQYYLRSAPNVGDIRVNLINKDDREHQSHALTLRLRDGLKKIAEERGANIKLVELPPGPPVMATIVAEVRGEPYHSYTDLTRAAKIVRARMEREPGVVDVDDTVEADQVRYVFRTDKEKAALSGVSTADIAQTLALALQGNTSTYLRLDDEVDPLQIEVILPLIDRSSLASLRRIYVKGATGALVTLGELGVFEESTLEKTIYHKNLQRVVYVTAEAAGRAPAECILDIQFDRDKQPDDSPEALMQQLDPADDFPAAKFVSDTEPQPLSRRTYFNTGGKIPWKLDDAFNVAWAGEGEWQITLRVFRDLGLAFGAALIGIYMLMVYQTGSYFMPLILMISIPLTLIGIMPGFWILNMLTDTNVGGFATPTFFTATAMIGMIALAGIAVRNAILLIEFVHDALRDGMDLHEALVQSGAVRTRPIFLTAFSAMLAAIPITLDPIFSGLAWALIFGLAVSTTFTLLLIPVVYWMVYKNRKGHGLPPGPIEDME